MIPGPWNLRGRDLSPGRAALTSSSQAGSGCKSKAGKQGKWLKNEVRDSWGGGSRLGQAPQQEWSGDLLTRLPYAITSTTFTPDSQLLLDAIASLHEDLLGSSHRACAGAQAQPRSGPLRFLGALRPFPFGLEAEKKKKTTKLESVRKHGGWGR